MPDLNFTLSGDNLTLTTVGGEKLVQTGDFSWSLVDGAQETVEYLPDLPVGKSYHIVYGAKRLRASWAGAAFQDGAGHDVPFTGNVVVPTDISALPYTDGALRLGKWYDQSGGGHHATQTNAAKQPGVRADAYEGGAPAILCDGGVNFIGGPQRGFDVPLAATGRACSLFFVVDFKASIQQELLFACAGSSGGAGGRTIYRDYTNDVAGRGASILEYSPAGTTAWPWTQFRAGPEVLCFREKAASPIDLFRDGVKIPGKTTIDMTSGGPTPTAETLTGGVLAYTAAGAAALNPNMRLLAVVMANGDLTDDEVVAITRCLQTNFVIPLRFDSRITLIGNSIAEGGANRNTLEWMWYLHQQAIKGTPEFYNLGIAQKTEALCYADRALYDAHTFRAGVPNVPIFEGGSNDLKNSVSAATLIATRNSHVAYWTALDPANVFPILCTIMDRTDFNSAMRTERGTYNADVRGGSLPYIDLDALLAGIDPNYAANPSILGDGIHPTSPTYALIAAETKTKINAVLP